MEGATSSSKASASASMAGAVAGRGASLYLKDLPSRGLFSSTVLSSNPGGMRVYLCEHDTSPPAEQFIKTNQTNILIRALTNNKHKNEGTSKVPSKGKRSSERIAEGNSAKRANANSGSSSLRQEASSSRNTDEFQGLTVDRLRTLLKEKGLSTKGKKDELVARLRANRDMMARLANDHEGEEN